MSNGEMGLGLTNELRRLLRVNWESPYDFKDEAFN